MDPKAKKRAVSQNLNGLKPDLFLSKMLGLSAYTVSDFSRFCSTLGDRARRRELFGRRAGLLTLKLDKLDTANLRCARSLGFHLVETALVYRKKSNRVFLPDGVRPAKASDERQVARIAGSRAFSHSRFYRERSITPERADRLKRAWARNFFIGCRGDAMYVAERSGRVAGFALFLKLRGAVCVDLIAVERSQRGRGLGRKLLRAAFFEAGRREVWVQTQKTNISSIRLYESEGFRLDKTYRVLHLVFKNSRKDRR